MATLGVLAWRLVNFWLPIPAGAVASVPLKVPRGGGLTAMRAAVSTLMSHDGPSGMRRPRSELAAYESAADGLRGGRLIPGEGPWRPPGA